MNDNISPILNNPYEEPKLHYDADLNGNLDYSKILEGRRPYSGNIGIAPNRPESALFTNDDIDSDDPNAPFINLIRKEVKKWRETGYPRSTRVTRELLNFWFDNPERQNFHKLFFCQREAVETAVYLNEIADLDPNVGRDILRQLNERVATISEKNENIIPRTAFKMATGTGKTVVMAMLILYNYLNKKVNPQDTRFADHFLLVAPGITIRDRLGVLYVDESRTNDQFKTDYYHVRNLIPRNYESHLGALNNAITIVNYHQFEPKVLTGKKASPMDGKLVYRPGEGMVKQSDKEGFASVLSRILGKMPKSKRILVINDEAHHCYLPRNTKSKGDEAEQNETAMVWYEGLRQLKALGYKLQHVYDLSATPYYLKGSGYVEYSLFPWVVSDFGLVDAIESGLVKIPFLPAFDDSHNLEEPVLRNIYERISKDLPKKGQKKMRKESKENKDDDSKGEKAPNLPSLLGVALEQFVKDYESYDLGMRQSGEKEMGLFSTPPVFIVVCNNTTVSKEVYKYIAGYETVDADGNTIYVDGKFPVFSNYTNGIPKKKQPSLLIDSAIIDNAGGIISDDFRRIFNDEIENFKKEYAALHGAGSADSLSDEDILREVVNSVGKQGTLGSHIRCVVSVSMLTEGWDANTVTHVLGVRAFGSQLLCEQVAGRALRRREYNLVPYNKDGEEIDSRYLNRYKPENVVWKFPPEYAHIIGVPFKTFKGGGTGTPPPSKPRTSIHAVGDRRAMEIRFPNIIGYRVEEVDGEIPFDYTGVSKFRMNFAEIPTKTVLESAVTDKEGNREVVLKSNYRDIRDQQVIYQLTRDLIREKYTDPDNGRQFQKFSRLKRIVEHWYYNQVEVVGGDGSEELRRLAVFFDVKKVVASIYEGIKMANRSEAHITPILNYYNPEGSTAYVRGFTTKPVYATEKSHVNYVVSDTDTWEQIAAKTFDEVEAVRFYVKNHFLDFRIPYVNEDEEKEFIPDFIVRVTTPKGEEVNLIVEISGWSNDTTGHKAEKRRYTTEFWIPAANSLKRYPRWDFLEINNIDNIKPILLHKIESL
ncbi:MAG: DEAD/DEAH box helicase family protein [Clostridium sp.]|nr:DEAD/DEAH box helicase family protein [Clostridium sp.]